MNRGVYDRPRQYDIAAFSTWYPCITLRKGTVIRSITFTPLSQACTMTDARMSDVISLGGLRFSYLIGGSAVPDTGYDVIAPDRWLWVPLAVGCISERFDAAGAFVGDTAVALGGNVVRLPFNFRVPEFLDGHVFWLYELAHDAYTSKVGVVFEVDELE